MKCPACSAIVTLVIIGCSSTNAPSHPAGLPLRYQNTRYDLTFFLPADWQGYSVLNQQWDAPLHSADYQEVVGNERGPIIVFRNPQWKADRPYQDIPVMVFTRRQWDALHNGRFFPYAGGIIGEAWHNREYVFGIYSRYNVDDSIGGWEEADEILERNFAAHTAPRLYAQ